MKMEVDKAKMPTGEAVVGNEAERRQSMFATSNNAEDSTGSEANQIIIIMQTNSTTSNKKARSGRRKMTSNQGFTVLIGKFSSQNQLVLMKTVISLITLTSILLLASGHRSEGNHRGRNLLAANRTSSANSFEYLLHNPELRARGFAPGGRNLFRFEHQPEAALLEQQQPADVFIQSLIGELELDRVFDAFSGSMEQVFVLFSPLVDNARDSTNCTSSRSSLSPLRRVHRAKRHLDREKEENDHDFELVHAQAPSRLAANLTAANEDSTHLKMKLAPTNQRRKKARRATQDHSSMQPYRHADDEQLSTASPPLQTERPESTEGSPELAENVRPPLGDELSTPPTSVAGITSDVELPTRPMESQSMKLTGEPPVGYDDQNLHDETMKTSPLDHAATHQSERGGQLSAPTDFQTTRRPRPGSDLKRKSQQMAAMRQQAAIPSPQQEVDVDHRGHVVGSLDEGEPDVVPQVGEQLVYDSNSPDRIASGARGHFPQNSQNRNKNAREQELANQQKELDLLERLISETKNAASQRLRAAALQKAHEQQEPSSAQSPRARLPPYGSPMTTMWPAGSLQDIQKTFANLSLSNEQENILGALLSAQQQQQNHDERNKSEAFAQDPPTSKMKLQPLHMNKQQAQASWNLLPGRVHFAGQATNQPAGRYTNWSKKRLRATTGDGSQRPSNNGPQMHKVEQYKQGQQRKLEALGSKRYPDFAAAGELADTTSHPRFESNQLDPSFGYTQAYSNQNVAAFTRPTMLAASQGLAGIQANLAALAAMSNQNQQLYNLASNPLPTLQSLTLGPRTTALNSQLMQASQLIRRQPAGAAVNLPSSLMYQRQAMPPYPLISAINRLGMAYVRPPQSQGSTKRQMSASGSGTHSRTVKQTRTQSQYDEPGSPLASSSSSLAATKDPIWSDMQNQEEDYQQAPQTIQITAVPNGLVGNGWNGGWNGWNGVNGLGGWNGRQVLLVNRQPQVGSEWRQWALPIAIILALPLVLGALFVPVFLKSVMFLIQILQMLGLLMPPHQLAGHLSSSTHSSTSG